MPKIITQEAYKTRCGEFGFTPISPYVSINSKIEVMCNKHGEKFITTLDQIKRCRCPKCYEENHKRRIDKQRLTNEKVDSRLKNRNVKRIGNVSGRQTKIEWECLVCSNRWLQSPCNVIHVNNPTGCPKCNFACPDTKESFKDKLNKKGRVDVVIIGNYKSSQTKTTFKCNKCDFEWESRPANILNLGRGCPCCHLKSEKLVGSILKQCGLDVEHNFYVKTDNKKFLIDWFVKDKNIAVEYHGLQHYEPRQFGGISIERARYLFRCQQLRDLYLADYCKNNKILLVEIDGRKYSYKNEEELKTFIINNVVENINANL